MKLFELIGNTPLIKLENIPVNPNVEIYCKLEGQNPGGSVKDRAAYHMIQSALDRGDFKRGAKLVEATSGNTGIALAMVANLLGVEMTLIMPDNATRERVLSMEAYGAKVILTPAEKSIEYARTLAEEMVESQGYFMLNQFSNPDNYWAHYRSTGPEIFEDTHGRVSHFVSAMGTTGTIMGVSRYLKEQNQDIQIVGTQPTDGSSIPGIRRWSPEFLPKIFDRERVDQVIDVSQEQATNMTRRMAKEEGILAGMSSGGALHAAVELSNSLESGVIVCITCDRGDRYLSSDLFG
ncbi:cysteine synthase CysM [Cyclobacterium amurskyense]|uniref:Cysteine synthase n=1 Tax=Cyclobacterium amurskyense TaxID=320787 RepID=A0A0H4PUH4_9BACT|nr:cysteine synthase CysM [Cyclobacterium amurskyense]AKP51962.1 Cysteine synthase [Cyclobacterium amurskyense]|tara:strand:+ start:7252 stop:8130 length:879 start_codon:yes stop_codon:yes gene_type:complete